MALVRFAVMALAMLLTPALAAAQDQEITVQADSHRVAIERILEADNLDTGRMTPREVVETMGGIERGHAPDDFWDAYQVHLRAWERFAGLVEQVQRQYGESTFTEGMEELAEAENAVNTTFDAVERIARRYGARIPVAPIDTGSIA